MSAAPAPETLFSPRRIYEQMGTGPALTLTDVGYAYGFFRRRRPREFWQIPHLSLEFRPGVVTALLGRNGAGKSTVMDLAAGRRRPLTGSVTLAGAPVWDHKETRSALCLLGSAHGLGYGLLSSQIQLFKTLHPLWSDSDYTRYLSAFEVDPDVHTARLSRGQLASAQAAVALASHSPVLLLDEIHLGMDAVVRRRFWQTLLDLYSWEKPTIVIAAHEIEEIEDLVEDAAVLSRGAVTASGNADELREACTPQGAPLASLTDVLEYYSATAHHTSRSQDSQNNQAEV